MATAQTLEQCDLIIRKIEANTSVNDVTGCVEWTKFRNPNGYGEMNIGGRKKMLSHRAAYNAVYGFIPHGLHILHKCDNPACVNVGHLYAGTQKDNMTDKKVRGRAVPGPGHGPGEKNPGHKLTELQAIKIRNDKRTQKQIAVEFGICQQTVSDIRTGKRWSYLGNSNG